MHRPSAYGNPEAPLSHHFLTRPTSRRRAARRIARNSTGVYASVFTAEPDEDRTDIDFGALDSYAVQLTWNRGPWNAQASGARLKLPEAIIAVRCRPPDRIDWLHEPESALTRGCSRSARTGRFTATRGDLVEATIRRAGADDLTRAESADKDILDAGFTRAACSIGTPFAGGRADGRLSVQLPGYESRGCSESVLTLRATQCRRTCRTRMARPLPISVFHYSLRGQFGGHVH